MRQGSPLTFQLSTALCLRPTALPPCEVDGQTREDKKEAEAGGLGGEVDEVEGKERSEQDVDQRDERISGRAIRARRVGRLATQDDDGADHQHVEDEVGRDDVFEQLRVDVAV